MPARTKRSNSDAPAERKTERLELRVTPAVKELIQHAAAISGLTPGDMAYETAQRLLETHERMHLTNAQRDAFFAALDRPSEPPDALVSALRRARELRS